MKTLNIFGKEVDIQSYLGEEKQELSKLLAEAKASEISPYDLKNHFADLKEIVIRELYNTPLKNVKRRLVLEARLYNYTDLEAFLSVSDRKKRELEKKIDVQNDVNAKMSIDTLI